MSVGRSATASSEAGTSPATSITRTEPCASASTSAACGNVTERSSGLRWKRSETSTRLTRRFGSRKVRSESGRDEHREAVREGGPERVVGGQVVELLLRRAALPSSWRTASRAEVLELDPGRVGVLRQRAGGEVDGDAGGLARAQQRRDLGLGRDVDVQGHDGAACVSRRVTPHRPRGVTTTPSPVPMVHPA